MTVSELVGTLPVPVATGNTDAAGGYSVTFTPPSSGSYQVSTGAISQVEIASLNPAYGDILSPAASSAIPLTVQGGVTIANTIVVHRRRDGHGPGQSGADRRQRRR